MKKVLILVTTLLMVVLSQAQIVRAFTPRYSNTSVSGNIVYVSNSIISTNGSTGTGEVPPAGTSTDNSSYGINIDVDNPAPVTKLNFASVWNYHANGAAPANDVLLNTWKQPAYVLPATWNVGATPVNGSGKYGFNSGQTTCIPNGTGVCNPTPGAAKYTAYYFRNTVSFTATELSTTYSAIRLNMKRQDGIVVYINGVERIRNNMLSVFPTVVAYGDLASSDISTGVAEDYIVNLSPAFFTSGVNTIAVEVHTDKAKSQDMSFDMQVQGINDNGTFNSSTSDLSIASCSEILFAGLYWGADQGTSGTDSSWIIGGYNTCKLKIPGASSYQTITSTQTDRHTVANSPGLNHTGYMCFKDITTLLSATSPNGTYTVADVLGPVNINNACGGWTIVIVYKNSALPPRNLTVFDGEAIVNGGDPAIDVTVSGFLTPSSGTVSCELGAVVYDGDRGSLDAWKFKQNGAALYYDLATTAIPLIGSSDAWNSVIAYKGSVITTRNPAYQNTLGYDAKIIDLPNAANAQLGNSQTSAAVQFSSPSENYFVQVVSTSISQFNPSFSLNKNSTDVNGGSLVSRDVLRYTIGYKNLGNDASTNSIIRDILPPNVGLVPGSLKINGVTKTDASGDDQANYNAATREVFFRVGTGANSTSGGTLAINDTGTVIFDVVIASSCVITNCYGASITNNARIDYSGQTTLQTLYDSSSYNNSGCYAKGATVNAYTASCYNPGDTTLINICPITSYTLPWSNYAGYTFYSGIPFTSGNAIVPGTLITGSGVYYAYFNSGTGCSDTIRINAFHQNCPDIDEDDDGIPDYVELGNPVALMDLDLDGILNWYDLDYPGRVDYNSDGLNDNFDPGADADNDGLVNFMDSNWPGYTDSNGDGINDNLDKDKDGIPNFLDRDSDNDGIPDTVESFGVDANGDGKIDNFTDTDADGLSQNVDASGAGATSVYGSGLGLGAVDTDGDGIPNYLDLDSDNDGIPDIKEVYGTDANNNGRVDVFVDIDLDGLADAIDGDVGNDGIAENSAAGLLLTGADANSDGRADTYPNKNMDADTKPNPYDLDSDGDGITDVKEAQFTDVDYNGRIDGVVNSDGWNITIAAMGSLTIVNSDASQKSDPYDIDSDNDGIPDNVEGQTTAGYLLPAAADTDGDGIDNSYDNFNGFGGDGIHPVDKDGDTIPDYLDADTDGDGLIDLYEGNDLNFNNKVDDGVVLTGLDTDGDGLDNFFDANNSSAEATSRYMGNGGTTSGDLTPGSITTVQHNTVSLGCATERDWRCVFYVLNCDIITFKASLQSNRTKLDWTVLCEQEVDHFVVERSIDGINFIDVAFIKGRPVINAAEAYEAIDYVTNIVADIIYYRLKTVSLNGKSKHSNIISLRRNSKNVTDVQILPNPVRDRLQLLINSSISSTADIYMMDGNGKLIKRYTENILQGSNTFIYSQASNLPVGLYYLRIKIGSEIIIKKFSVIK